MGNFADHSTRYKVISVDWRDTDYNKGCREQ